MDSYTIQCPISHNPYMYVCYSTLKDSGRMKTKIDYLLMVNQPRRIVLAFEHILLSIVAIEEHKKRVEYEKVKGYIQ